MHCALCQTSSELRKSHIIPEFLYQSLYDEKHRFNVLTSLEHQENSIEQKGIREALLCSTCETLLSRYERYGSLVLRGGAKGIKAQRTDNVIVLEGIDYKVFKLFLLSILWRAGASGLEMFRHVRLGPHAERIRVMLLRERPGSFVDYSCVLFGLSMVPNETPGLIVPPEGLRIGGQRAYRFVLPGLMAVFFVSTQPVGAPYNKFVLQANGSIVVQVRSVMELPTLHKFMEKFDKLGRPPKLDA